MASTAGDMSLVCRCCLQKENDLINIFKEIGVGDPLSFAALVENCVGIEIVAGDGLPKLICTKCSTEASNFFNFKKMCLHSEKILRPSAVVELEPLKNVACQTAECQHEPKIPVCPNEQFEKEEKQFEKEDEQLEKEDEQLEKEDKQFEKEDKQLEKEDKEFEKEDKPFEKEDKPFEKDHKQTIEKVTIGIQEQIKNEIDEKENDKSNPDMEVTSYVTDSAIEKVNITDTSASDNAGKEDDDFLSETEKQDNNMDVVINNPVLPLSGESIFTVLDIAKEKDKDVIDAVKVLGEAVEKLSSCNSRLSGDLEEWLEGNDVKGGETSGDASDQLSNVGIGVTVGNYIDSSSSNNMTETKLVEKDEKTENLMKERDGDDAVVLEDLKQKLNERLQNIEAKENEFDVTASEKSSCDVWKPVDSIEGKLIIKSIEALTNQSSKEGLNEEAGPEEDLSLRNLLKTSQMNDANGERKDASANSQAGQISDKSLGQIISISLDGSNEKVNKLNEDGVEISSESKSLDGSNEKVNKLNEDVVEISSESKSLDGSNEKVNKLNEDVVEISSESKSLDGSNEKVNEVNEEVVKIALESKSHQDAEDIEGDRARKRPWVDDEKGSEIPSVSEGGEEGPITKKICLSESVIEEGESGEVVEKVDEIATPHDPKSMVESQLQDTDQSNQQNEIVSQIESAEEKGNVEKPLMEENLKDFYDEGLFEDDDSEPESSGSEYIPADSPARSDESLTIRDSNSKVKTRVRSQISKLKEQDYKLRECRVVLSDIAHPNSNALSTTSSISSRISTPSRINDSKEADETRSTSSCTAWIKVEPELEMKEMEVEEENAEENTAEAIAAEEEEIVNVEDIVENQETAAVEENMVPDTAEPQGISAETQRPLAKFVSGRKRFLCPFCAKAFRTKSQMMLHRSLHTGDLPYPCEVCGKRFPLRCRLLRHMSVHDASITCEFCGMDFKTHILLGRHIKARHTIPSYTYSQVNLHPQPVANKSGQRFPCRLCPKVFSTVNGLKVHKRVHVNATVKLVPVTEERVQPEEKIAVTVQDTCKICGMTFPNALYLKSHMVCHNIIRPNSGKLMSIESPKPQESSEDNQRAAGNLDKNIIKTRDESLNVMEPTVLIHESSSSYGEPSYQQQNQQYNRMNRFVCSVCSQIFQSRSQLLRHQTLIHRSLKCEICACMFSSADEVQSHKLAEHPSYNADMIARKRHKCNICGKAFPKHSRLIQHMAVHTTVPRQSGCEVCGKYFASPELLEMHKKTHETTEAAGSSIDGLTCGVCQRVFAKRSRLKRHMLLHESQSFPCSKCPKTFISRELLAEHQSIHSTEEEQGVSCTACGRMFTNRGRLKQHVAVHTKSGFVSCDNCFKVFANKQVLDMHVQTCTNPNESPNSSQPATSSRSALTPPPPSGFASCASCNKAFPTKNLLTEHEKTCVGLTVVKKLDGTWKVLDNEDRSRGATRSEQSNKSEPSEGMKVFACKMCTKRFNNYHGLNSHMRFHQESVGIYKCELCHKKFPSRNKLSQHMSSHSAVYRCGICSQAFGMVDELKKHVSQCMVAQTGVAPNYFFCNGCSEVFNLLEELAEHVKCHAEEFPHVCTECYKVFAQSVQLSRHIVTHMKEEKSKHTCTTCQKTFINSAALEKHRVVHTGEKRFQCAYCFQRFSQKSSLNRHQLTQHETKP